MSFECGKCGKHQQDGIKATWITIKIRRFVLEPFQTEDPVTGLVVVSSRHRDEIAEQKLVCPKCAASPPTPEIIYVEEAESI